MDNIELQASRSLHAQLAEAIAAERRGIHERDQLRRDHREVEKAANQECRKATKYRQKLERIIRQLESTRKVAEKSDVIERTRELLAENPAGIDVAELKPFVQDSLRDKGFALTGAFRHWDKWLAEMSDVVVEHEHVRLVVTKEN